MKILLMIVMLFLSACSDSSSEVTPKIPSYALSVKGKTLWKLNPRQSMITLGLTKDDNIPVYATFVFDVGAADLSGDSKPVFEAAVNLSSFNSDLIARDERVVKLFFGVVDALKPQFMTFKIEEWSEDLKTFFKADESLLEGIVSGEVSLAGKSIPVSLNAKISKTKNKNPD